MIIIPKHSSLGISLLTVVGLINTFILGVRCDNVCLYTWFSHQNVLNGFSDDVKHHIFYIYFFVYLLWAETIEMLYVFL